MGERTHTPGPWTVGMASGRNACNVYARSDEAVAQVFGIAHHASLDEVSHNPRDQAGLANARLIAAAPDMFAALQAARQFIANGIELGFIRMPDADTPDPAHDTLPAIEAALAKASPHV